MSKMNKILYFIFSAIFFAFSDIYFSELFLDTLRYKIPENPVLDLIFVKNTGAAFSILENSRIFLIVFSLIALFLIVLYVIKNAQRFSAFACFWAAMLASGIACNLYERVAFGYVRDFLKLNFIDFPVFNISDLFINVSVLALIIIIVKNKYLRR